MPLGDFRVWQFLGDAELIIPVSGLSGAMLGRECVTDTQVSISEEKAYPIKPLGEQPGLSITTGQGGRVGLGGPTGKVWQAAFLKWLAGPRAFHICFS